MRRDHRACRPTVLVVCLIAASAFVQRRDSALAQSGKQEERVAAAFVLAIGRTPTTAEAQRWLAQGDLSIADLVARHRRELDQDGAARREMLSRAARDAFGGIAESERRPPGGRAGSTYFEVVQQYLQWLANRPADYQQVLRRAYRTVLQRDAYSIEIDYWRRQPALTFALLAGCVENWAIRNRPGLTATSGLPSVSVNSAYLATVRLSPEIAAEARAAVGQAPVGGRTLASAASRHVIAPGAADILSVGGIHFLAAGNARLEEMPAEK